GAFARPAGLTCASSPLVSSGGLEVLPDLPPGVAVRLDDGNTVFKDLDSVPVLAFERQKSHGNDVQLVEIDEVVTLAVMRVEQPVRWSAPVSRNCDPSPLSLWVRR
ncbi:MAG TPA: hypothetical protein VJH06_03575, partial [Candidatus Paceibacterota bacterium]